MKKIVIITILVLIGYGAQARPAYTNGQYYIWADANVASNALNYINSTDWFPAPGKNKKTGEDVPNQTTSWATEMTELKDGRVGFLRIPEAVLDRLGVSEADRELYWTAFSPTAIVLTEDMIKNEDE